MQVTPNNGAMRRMPWRSGSTTIADSLPVATVTLDPASPTTNQILTANATTFDADGDVVTLTYIWTRTDPVTGVTTTIQTTVKPRTRPIRSTCPTPSSAARGRHHRPGDTVRRHVHRPGGHQVQHDDRRRAARSPTAPSMSISHNNVQLPERGDHPPGRDRCRPRLADLQPGQRPNGGAADGTVTINGQRGHLHSDRRHDRPDSFQFVASDGTLTSTRHRDDQPDEHPAGRDESELQRGREQSVQSYRSAERSHRRRPRPA